MIYQLPDINLSDMLPLILYMLSLCLIILLTTMASVLLVNFLIRPKLWTAFNIVILIYFLLTIILGSFNVFIITSIISQNLDYSEDVTNIDMSQVMASQFQRWCQLEQDCLIYIIYSGTWMFREGILTGMIFTR